MICSKYLPSHQWQFILTLNRSHQTWGMKYNFSVYASFWDRMMGTYWAGHDSKAQEKYARGRKVAEESVAKNRSADKALKAEARETDAGFSTAAEL